MKVKLVDKKEKKNICTADILFGLDVLIVDQCDGMNTEALQNFLQNRAEFKDSYEMDNIVLEKLDLMYKKNDFGRMSEACVLYAMLCNFEKEDDDIALYPIRDEIFSMFCFDSNYTNLYIWRTNNDFDESK